MLKECVVVVTHNPGLGWKSCQKNIAGFLKYVTDTGKCCFNSLQQKQSSDVCKKKHHQHLDLKHMQINARTVCFVLFTCCLYICSRSIFQEAAVRDLEPKLNQFQGRSDASYSPHNNFSQGQFYRTKITNASRNLERAQPEHTMLIVLNIRR